jgi:hypothetical protein
MRLVQELKFLLHLSLNESYIYGTATMDDKWYSINIQQAKNQLIVLPQDFSDIGEPGNALISFSRQKNTNSKEISMTSEIHVGQRDLIEVYLDQDDMLLSLAKDLPVEITIRMYTTSTLSNEGR